MTRRRLVCPLACSLARPRACLVALLLAADCCGLRRLVEDVMDDDEELQFAGTGLQELEHDGFARTLFAAGRQLLTGLARGNEHRCFAACR